MYSMRLIQAVLLLGWIVVMAQLARAQVTLAKDGQAAATIVVPDADVPSVTAWKAGQTLREHLARACGAELPVTAASQAPSEGTLILVGRSALSERHDIPAPSQSEGARIATFPRGLAIIGEVAPAGTNNLSRAHDRGTMHGVYIFLEKHVGFRFYFTHGSDGDLGVVVPHRPTLTVGPLDETLTPAFPYRQIHGWRQDMLLAGSATGFRCNHTHVGWDRHYKKEHPEYFSLQADGSRDFRYLCYSNPGVLKRELEHIEAYYKTGRWIGSRNPTDKYIQVEPTDNWRECQCDRCQAWIDPERGRYGKHSRLWWDHYIRKLALAVKQRWPGKRISALAYQGRVWPGQTELPDNVDVMVCISNGPVNFHKEPSAREEVGKLLSAWSRKVGGDRSRLYVWDYGCHPHFWTCAPTLNPNVRQRFLREHRGRIGGVFNNTGSETIQGSHFLAALTMRLLWEPDLDVDQYLRDYCRSFFGPGAEAMERVYRLLIDRYERVLWPGYRSFAYAPPTMFYGRTYTPEVVEQVEQGLWDAQQAVGLLPGGLAAEFVDEGWFIRRNGSDRPAPFEIVLEAVDQPVPRPTIRWDGGQMVYDGVLSRGQKLVVRPGPKARVLPVPTSSPPELIPPASRLAGELRAFSKGYGVHLARPRAAAYPGAKFRITINGKARDGANSHVGVRRSNGKSSFVLTKRLGSEQRTVSQVVTAPAGVRRLDRVTLYRRNNKGTVWYGDLSLKRELPEPAADLPAQGRDVTARIEGDAPVVPARSTLLFQVFSNSLAPGALRGEAVDLDIAADRAADGEATTDEALSGGTALRVTVRPQGGDAGQLAAGEPTIYQRRVAWMRDGWENFRPKPSMYATHDGFLVAARTAHAWIDRTPTYRVGWTASPPAGDLGAAAWARTAVISLVRGRSRAGAPVDNLGFAAGNGPTRVRLLQDSDHVYAAFECFQPERPGKQDSVTLALYRGVENRPLLSVSCGPCQPGRIETPGVIAKTAVSPGRWTALVTVAKSSVDGGLVGDCRADLLRTRAGGRSYLWSPPLAAPWTDMPMERRGVLRFGKQQ